MYTAHDDGAEQNTGSDSFRRASASTSTTAAMFTFSGFNGFGQVDVTFKNKQLMAEKFLKFDVRTDGKLIIAPSWSYTAYASGRQLRLQGFLSAQPNASMEVVTEADVKQLCAVDNYCLVLLENGRLYKLLPQVDGRLQEVKLAVEQTVPHAPKRNIFGECQPAEQLLRITHIACGAHIAIAFSSCNAVYSIPSCIHKFPKHFRLKQLLCGFEHALLLSCNGDVYSWGNGLRGQLGQAVLRLEETPTLVEALAGIKITHIAAAGWHSAAISAFGDLYTWGYNSNGQLGMRLYKPGIVKQLKEPTVYPLPQIIDLPKCCTSVTSQKLSAGTDTDADDVECTPLRVFAGARHTVVQLSCGSLFASGWNAHLQLPFTEHKAYADAFERLQCADLSHSTSQSHQLQVICGPWCTILCN